MRHKRLICFALALCLLGPVTHVISAPPETRTNDPHYTAAGFFDLHVCNWPDRPMFFMTVFSSTVYDNIRQIDVYTPNGQHLGVIDMDRYRLIKRKDKKDKRVFIKQIPLPENAAEGWYYATATMRDGRKIRASDYVVLDRMSWASGGIPADGAEDIPVPTELRWEPIPGASYYQVFIKDLWEGEKTILTSRLLDKPVLKLEPGLLQANGWYEWRIHARDVNEHILLGDFNHGSLGPVMKFTTRAE